MKKLICIITVIMIFLFVNSFVQAESSTSLSFTSNKEEIERGEEVVLTISGEGLTGIEGKLNFDSSVLTLKSKSSQNSFTINEQTGKFALANIAGEENISVDITFKSNVNSNVDSTKITLSEIIGSNLTGNGIDLSNKEVTIKFKKTTTEKEDNNSQNISNTITNTTSNTVASNTTYNTIGSNSKNSSSSKTEAKDQLPHTGIGSICIGMIILISICSISYIRYKKLDF